METHSVHRNCQDEILRKILKNQLMKPNSNSHPWFLRVIEVTAQMVLPLVLALVLDLLFFFAGGSSPCKDSVRLAATGSDCVTCISSLGTETSSTSVGAVGSTD